MNYNALQRDCAFYQRIHFVFRCLAEFFHPPSPSTSTVPGTPKITSLQRLRKYQQYLQQFIHCLARIFKLILSMCQFGDDMQGVAVEILNKIIANIIQVTMTTCHLGKCGLDLCCLPRKALIGQWQTKKSLEIGNSQQI